MKKQKYINIILSIITSVGITLNYMEIYTNGITKHTTNFLSISPLIACIIFIAILVFYNKFNKKSYKTNWLQNLVSMFLSLVFIFGRSFEEINSWDLIFKNKLTILISIIGIIGYFILFKVVFSFLNYIINKIDLDKIKFIKENKLIKIFDDKPFLISLLTILIFWLIYIIAFYPGILNYDSCYQILQALGIHTKYVDWVIQLDPNVTITNHHPVIYTLFLGACVKIGQAIGNDNFGIFIATIIQTLIFASTLAYTIKYLKKIGISSKIRTIILAIYCIVPMFPFYAITNVKDTIYTSLVILYIIKLYDYIKFYKNKKISTKQIITWLLLMIMIALFRNNGIYLVLISFIFAVFYTKVNVKKMLVTLIIYVLLYESYVGVILPYFKIPNTSTREMLSVPFQQTARYVKEYENEVTEEEQEVIDKILGYETLAERYKPQIADPVKNQYNKYTTTEDLKEYFKVWLNGLKKHPGCYVETFLNNTYAYFYPSNNKWYIYYSKLDTINKKGNIDYHFYKPLQPVRKILTAYGNTFRSIPCIGLISNIGFNTCVILIYAIYLIGNKNKRKYLIVLLPHFVTLLFCLLSPVNNYFRYAMPYIFAMPITTVFFIKEITNKGEERNGKK